MPKKDFSSYRRKYDISRHHAWAGTALLSVLMALRYIFALIPNILIILLGSVIIIYILVALGFTFKYREALSAEQRRNENGSEAVRERSRAAAEKELSKLEKKRTKAEVKAKKKR